MHPNNYSLIGMPEFGKHWFTWVAVSSLIKKSGLHYRQSSTAIDSLSKGRKSVWKDVNGDPPCEGSLTLWHIAQFAIAH